MNNVMLTLNNYLNKLKHKDNKMKLRNVLLAAALTLTTPAFADDSKITKGYNTMDSMGCMLLGECTDGVKKVYSMLDISSQYDNTDDFTSVTGEFHNILHSLNLVGVNVFLADSKYFPDGHRGVYHLSLIHI